MAATLDEFAQQIIDLELVTSEQLAALRAELPAPDLQGLAKLLVQRKLLTAYQAKQIYAGQGRSLLLGNYLILDKLGQGGMGMVLKAQHRRMNRMVAIKVLSPAVTKSPEMTARFHREVQAAARLEHPNIVTAYDADEAHGTHFLVMQYVEGSDLSSLVKKKGPLLISRAVECIRQTARGLAYAHSQGVIHRDIKPANLLLDLEGTVRILDMGLARIEGDASQQAELTSTGAVMGTVDYMSPEQARNTKTAEARSDQYSLGVTLWYLLTGAPMYDGHTLTERLLAHQSNPIPSLTSVREDVPPALEAIYQRMVAKQPDDRYRTMNDLVAALDDWKKDPSSSSQSLLRSPSEESQLHSFLQDLTSSSSTRMPEETRLTAARPEMNRNTTSPPTPLVTGNRNSSSGSRLSKRLSGPMLAGGAACGLLLVLSLAWSIWSNGKKKEIARGERQSKTGTGKSVPSGSPSAAAATGPSPSGPNYALSFDGTGTVDLQGAMLNLSQPFTIEAFVRQAEPPPRETGFPGIIFAYDKVALGAGDNWRFYLLGANPNQSFQHRLDSPQTEDQKLVHLAGVYDGREMRLFENGDRKRLVDCGKNLPAAVEVPLQLGLWFVGEIDEIRISRTARYSKNFTPARRMNADRETVALYHCDQGQGNTLTDDSGQGHDGYLAKVNWVAVKPDGSIDGHSKPSPIDLDNWTADEAVSKLLAQGVRLATGDPTAFDEVTSLEQFRVRKQPITAAWLTIGRVRGAELTTLKPFRKDLRWLEMFYLPVTDDEFLILEELPELRSIAVEHTQFGDRSLSLLRRSPHLHTLLVGYSAVTAASLPLIAEFKDLQNLSLCGMALKVADLELLNRLPIAELNLDSVKEVGDEVAAWLMHFPAMRYLNLSRTSITDKTIASLQELKSLAKLELGGANVTDAAVPSLVQMKALVVLGLEGTQMTRAAVEQVSAALPDCQINFAGQRFKAGQQQP